MEPSVLESKLKSLDATWSSLDSWVKFWMVLVVLGVALEIVAVVVEYFREEHDFNRGTIHSPEKPSGWLLLLGLLGAGLVALGVGGEFITHIKAGKVESDMRSATQALIQRNADDARERVSKNEKDTQTLKTQAEHEGLERMKIEERVAWRRLTKEQQYEIGTKLRPFSGELVLPQYNSVDLEAGTFASDIAWALHQATWNVYEPVGMLMMREGPVPLGTNPPLDTGVLVKSTKDEASRDAAAALSRELDARGFDSTVSPETDPRSVHEVFVIIWHRPEGPQGEAKLGLKKAQQNPKLKTK
ncbi:MAG TPA: hypothetical protein VEO19_12710 [Terriglobia bacterium]|nr:hypothetical protein [Terriglobia bacterium]